MLALKRFDLAHPANDADRESGNDEASCTRSLGDINATQSQEKADGTNDVVEVDCQPKMTQMQLILQKAIVQRRKQQEAAELETKKAIVDPKKMRSDYLASLNKEFEAYEQEMISKDEVQLEPDSINFWKSQVKNYPILAPTALDLVSCPMTEVSVERLFSHLTFILNPLRNRLTGDILQDILFLRVNNRFGTISDSGKKQRSGTKDSSDEE